MYSSTRRESCIPGVFFWTVDRCNEMPTYMIRRTRLTTSRTPSSHALTRRYLTLGIAVLCDTVLCCDVLRGFADMTSRRLWLDALQRLWRRMKATLAAAAAAVVLKTGEAMRRGTRGEANLLRRPVAATVGDTSVGPGRTRRMRSCSLRSHGGFGGEGRGGGNAAFFHMLCG